MKLGIKIFILLYLVKFSTICWSQDFVDMDGLKINAVEGMEEYPPNEFITGISYLPFDPYYSYYGFNFAYSRYFNNKWGWQVFNYSFLFAVDKSLRSELAEEYSVTVKDIRKTSYLLSSNLRYNLSFGKSLFLKDYIRKSKTDLLFGLGTAASNFDSGFTVNVGLEFDFFLSKENSIKVTMLGMIPNDQQGLYFLHYSSVGVGLARRY